MKAAALVLSALLAAAPAAAAPPDVSPAVPPPSPCGDSLYLALKTRPLTTLSKREYAYVVEKDRDCVEWQRLKLRMDADAERRHEIATEIHRRNTTYATLVGVGLVGALMAFIVLSTSGPGATF